MGPEHDRLAPVGTNLQVGRRAPWGNELQRLPVRRRGRRGQPRRQMAYTVGFERFNEILADGEKKPWTVRVTHAYRREEGEWKIVHRHGDQAPVDESRPAVGETR